MIPSSEPGEIHTDRGHLATEVSNPDADGLETISMLEAVDLLRREDARVIDALEGARDDLARVCTRAADALKAGGRVIYVGAGTSGRLGVLDASECPPTFGVEPERVQAVIAGGRQAVTGAMEGAEDNADAGADAIAERSVSATDLVVGITAGGTTPFVHAALDAARERGAATAFITCVPRDQVPDDYDESVRLLVGPEVLAGSSRMKAGTATKLALNAISTLAMSRIGKTHRGHMVDVDTSANKKLVDRGARLIVKFGGVDRARALLLLEEASGHAKTAIVMAAKSVDANAARAALSASSDDLGKALES